MVPDICFYVLVTYAKILAHVRDQVRRFYGNCRILHNWENSGSQCQYHRCFCPVRLQNYLIIYFLGRDQSIA